MTTLSLIGQSQLPGSSAAQRDYVRDLTRSVVATAPRNCDTQVVLSKTDHEERSFYERHCPTATIVTVGGSPALVAATWSRGLGTRGAHELSHSASWLAPLHPHDGVNDGVQTTLTLSDTTPWSHPHAYTPAQLRWYRRQLNRAKRHADAIVLPSHTAAVALNSIFRFGDRLRVLPTGVPTSILSAASADDAPIEPPVAAPYLVAEGGMTPLDELGDAIAALSPAHGASSALSLVIIARDGINQALLQQALHEHQVSAERIRVFTSPNGNTIQALYRGAMAHVITARSDRFPTSMLVAMTLGVPVVHFRTDVLEEVSAGAGHSIELPPLDDPAERAARLSAGITEVAESVALRQRLSTLASDRSHVLSWREAGERVWQLHAEL